MQTENKEGDLRVWWIPQIPGPSFKVPIGSIADGVLLMKTLADYDIFQLENNIKPDYSSVGGIETFELNFDGEGTAGWVDWYDHETGEDDPEVWLNTQTRNSPC